ncbi:MAG TPA: NAD(P)-dependent oxidoreductase [Syntrophorhabdaceae bacterium]|jgi:3-hydroxyisobutyrate dehydrogenase
MKTGFIGLGTLGKTIAKRLVSRGVELMVWNRTRAKAVEFGAPVAESPVKVLGEVDVVFLNLFDSKAVEEVIFGPGGFMEGDLSGKTIIDTTTNHFDRVAAFHQRVREKGGRYLEAPVLGSVVPASEGNLTVLVSGEKDAYEQQRPLIEIIGKNIFYLPRPSTATKMKLINNLLLGTFMAAISEAMVFGEAAGVDKEQVLDIFAAGAGNSGVLNAKRKKLLTGDFSPHFSSALIYKDLHYLEDLARTLKRPLFTGSPVKELFALTFKGGKDQLDFSVLYEVLKGL